MVRGSWYVVARESRTPHATCYLPSSPHTTYYLPPTVLLYSMRGNSEEQIKQAPEMGLANFPQQNGKRLNPDSKVGSRRASRITIRCPFDADTGGTEWCGAGRRGTARCTPVQISERFESSTRLCRPAVRKASGFPANAGSLVLLPAGWKAQPSSLRGGGCSGHRPFGKAKPFRTAGGGAAGRRRPDRG